MNAISGTSLKHDNKLISLWGVSSIPNGSALNHQRARMDLNNAIAAGDVNCYAQSQSNRGFLAQCFNFNNTDLSVWMLRQGYAVVNRAAVIGTDYERSYLDAEALAQQSGVGIWLPEQRQDSFGAVRSEFRSLTILSFVFFVITLGVIAALVFLMLHGFQKVQDSIDQNAQILIKHNKLREKERDIVAVMLFSELKANQSKIEAFLVVYEELLRTLKNPHEDHQYLKSGEVVREAPSLDRYIFDGNVDKLDVLGQRLAESLIEFYAQINPNPDYKNLDPDTEHEVAISTVQTVVDHAKGLQQTVDELIKEFEDSGFQGAGLLFNA